MKIRLVFTLFFSALSFLSFAQEDKAEAAKTKWKYEPNFMIGFDVLNTGASFFSDRKIYQGFISSRIKESIHGIVDAGFERNIYEKNGYDAEVNGPFLRLGAFYMLAQDRENEFNGFYGGGKLAASFYKQEYASIPVRGYAGNNSSIALPSSSQSSYWVEGLIGGRVQLFDTNFYIDVNMQPKYLIATSKQEDVDPMIIPGFGRSSSKFNMGFSWNIAYKF